MGKSSISRKISNKRHITENTSSKTFSDGMNMFELGFKRIFDVISSLTACIILFPTLLVIVLFIWMEDGRPVLFLQERIGKDGKPFTIYKFRTMVKDAEKFGPELCHSCKMDKRLTKIGGFLRAHHLDELPQLWNVIKGDMSLVGYRPERQFFIDQIIRKDARYILLYKTTPGLTSLSTVYNGYTDSIEKMCVRLEWDLWYIGNRTLWMDLQLIILTFLKIIRGKKI